MALLSLTPDTAISIFLETLKELLLNLIDIFSKLKIASAANALLSIFTNLNKLKDCEDFPSFIVGAVVSTVALGATALIGGSLILTGGLGTLLIVSFIAGIQSVNAALLVDTVINSDDCKA